VLWRALLRRWQKSSAAKGTFVMQWWKRKKERLEEEIRAHIELETQENIEIGMSPEEARHAAMKKFGNVSVAVERSREIRGWLPLEHVLQDIRYALRGLKNAPGYAATVVLTLVIGLGSVAAMLAIVDSVLWHPMALPHPEQLVMLYWKGRQEGTVYTLPYEQIDALRRNAHSLTAAGGYNTTVQPVGTQGGTRMAVHTVVTPDFFHMLGVHAKLGRLLSSADGKSPVAVISAAFWRDRLHSDPKAIGSTVQLSGKLWTIVGVLPENVHFPQGTEAPVVYTPVSLNAKGEDDLFADGAMAMARKKQGVSMQRALTESRSILSHSEARDRTYYGTLEMRSYKDFLTGDMRTWLFALLGAVAVLLLIACTNAANLQISRMSSRMTEMNMRSALGASYRRLLQQVVTESLVVSCIGAILGGVLAYVLIAVIRTAYGPRFSRFDELTLHPGVFGAMALIALLTGVLASMAPAFNVCRQTDVRIAPNRSRIKGPRLPGFLVALQVALTCVLLATSGLFVRTIHALQDVKLGFDPRGVTTLVLMPEDQHINPEIARETDTRLLERFQSLPGVKAATMQNAVPFSNYHFFLNGTTEISGRPYHEGDSAYYSLVSSNFVQASGIHLLQGRSFLPRDDTGKSIVVLVNQAFVKKFLVGHDLVGTTLRFHRNSEDKDSDLPFTQTMTIVGVVENELQGSDLSAPYEPMVYLDYLQLPKDSMMGQIFSMMAQFAVRSSLPESVIEKGLRTVIKQTAPEMAEMYLQPMETGINQSLSQRRLALRLVAGFGGIALLLSAIGIYGMLAYSVALRRREIGIRMALGSTQAGVVRLVLQQAAVTVFFGLVPGVIGAWAAGRAVKSFLFGVSVLDPVSLAGSAVVLLLACAMAATLPAWRAAQVDPMEVLRTE
jgi:predicted permease